MKKEDIKKPNPEGLEKAIKLINELAKKEPSEKFLKEIEDTEAEKSNKADLFKIGEDFSNE